VVTFGAKGGDVRLLSSRLGSAGSDNEALIFGERFSFRLNVPGRHMVMNALGVLAVAALLGIDPEEGATALAGFGALAGRGARRRLPFGGGEILLIDESYNASPAAVGAALETLGLAEGRRIAVLGDMLELGAHGPAEHRALAPLASANADLVFAAGPLMRELFDAIPSPQRGAWAPDAATLAPAVEAALRPGDVVLVKGSYGMGMKHIVDRLSGEGRT
jgi:UDP-N-acetylmuramoyl-tripeptide--D-alanyl-D-alanine ligase